MAKSSHKVTVSVGDKTITFEGPREFVEEQLARYIGAPSKTQDQRAALTASDASLVPSLGKLVETKKPKGHSETVAVLAFGLAGSGLTEFTESDMRRAYIQAGVRPPKVVGQALRDARKNKDYIGAGKKRGTYKLSSHGDRTVRFDLPRG
jgi:hypothetical protein